MIADTPVFEVSTEDMRDAARGVIQTPYGTLNIQWSAEEGRLLFFTEPESETALNIAPIASNAISLSFETSD